MDGTKSAKKRTSKALAPRDNMNPMNYRVLLLGTDPQLDGVRGAQLRRRQPRKLNP